MSKPFLTPIVLPAAASGYASMRLPHGADPGAVADGSLWTTASGLYARINNATVGPFGTASVAGSTSQVQYNSSGAFAANSDFTYTAGTAASYDGTAGSSWSTTGTLAASASGSPHSIAGNGSRIIAANSTFSGNAAYISANGGTTWTAITSLFGVSYGGVAWTGKNWILGANNQSYVKYSDDNGLNWVTASLTNTDSYSTLIVGTGSLEGIVVAIGVGLGYIKYSTNHGVTWANATAPPGSSGILTAAKGCCTGTEFILYSGTYCWYSTNGSTWTTRTSTAVGTAVYLQGRGLVYDPVNDCLTGITGNTTTNTKILFSNDDGATWSYQTAPNTSAATDIAVVNGVRIITCTSGNVHRSTDNSTWSNSTAGASTLNAICHSIGQGVFLFPLSTNQPYKAVDGYTAAVLANVTNTSGKFSASALALLPMTPPPAPTAGLVIADKAYGGRLSVYDGTTWRVMGTGGPDTAVQFNAAGAQAGSPNFLFDGMGGAMGGSAVSTTSWFVSAASAAAKSPLRITTGTDITTPVAGDFWATTTGVGLFYAFGANDKGALLNTLTDTTNMVPVFSTASVRGRVVASAMEYTAAAGGLTQFRVNCTYTGTASNLYGFQYNMTVTNTVQNAQGSALWGTWNGLYAGVNATSAVRGVCTMSLGVAGAAGDPVGVWGVGTVSSNGLWYSGPNCRVIGVRGDATLSQNYPQTGTDLIKGAIALSGRVAATFTGASGTATISGAYGVKIEDLSWSVTGGRTVTLDNYYGIFIGTGGGTNNYGIYQSDAAATNYFAGSVTFAGAASFSNVGTITFTSGYITLTPSALPSTAAGRIAIDSGASNALKWYDGTAWKTAVSGAAGSDTQLQYNNAGAFGGLSTSAYNATDGTLTFTVSTTANAKVLAVYTTSTGTLAAGDSIISVLGATTADAGATADTASYTGVRGSTTSTSSATLLYATSSFYGGSFSAAFVGAGTSGTSLVKLSAVSAVVSAVMGQASGSTTITSVRGLEVLPGTFSTASGGTTVITDYYGLYLGALTTSGSGTTTITNRWGVYQADSAAYNVFAGKLVVAGTTTSSVTSLYATGPATAADDNCIAHFKTVAGPSSGTSSVYGVRIEGVTAGDGTGSVAYGLHIASITPPTLGGAYGVYFDAGSAQYTTGFYIKNTNADAIGVYLDGGCRLVSDGNVEITDSTKYFYLGSPATEGTWRIGRSGNNLVMERYESGSYVTKQTILA